MTHRQGSRLTLLGLLFVGMAAFFAATRNWQYGAKATISGVFGLSYLLMGSLSTQTESVEQLFKRFVYSTPVGYIGVFAFLELGRFLASGTFSVTIHTALRASWATLLGFPVGLGYVYGRAETAAQEHATIVAAACSVGVGAAIAGLTWTSIWRSVSGRIVLVLISASLLVYAGAVPPYLIARYAPDS